MADQFLKLWVIFYMEKGVLYFYGSSHENFLALKSKEISYDCNLFEMPYKKL